MTNRPPAAPADRPADHDTDIAVGRAVGRTWAALEHGEAPPDDVDDRIIRRIRLIRSRLGRP